MKMAGNCIYFLLPVLTLSCYSDAAGHNTWPELGGGVLPLKLLQTRLSEVWSNLSVPFPIWNLNLRRSFNLRLMNSSWSGPADTNVIQKGESVYLQVSASTGPDQELYIQSCYATSSSDPNDKSKFALILNKGCVSSKQSPIEFISRQLDSINLLLDSSGLKFSQMYVHCSMVFSSAVTPHAKSCNYKNSKSNWVELGGQTRICKCCESKCKGPPSYGGLSNDLKALVSTGPVTIKDVEHEGEHLRSNSLNATSQVRETGTNLIVSGTFLTLLKKSPTTISKDSNKKPPYSPSLLAQPVMSYSIMVISQDSESALSLWLQGLLIDVASDMEKVNNIPKQKSTAKPPTLKPYSHTSSEEIHQEAHDWRAQNPGRVHDVYMSNSPGLKKSWDRRENLTWKGFHSPEEELRGDVFLNYKWPQHYDFSDEVQVGALMSDWPERLPEKLWEKNKTAVYNQTKKDVGNEFEKTMYVKINLNFSQASDGSTSLSYEEEEGFLSIDEQEVKKSVEKMEWRKIEEKGKILLGKNLINTP
ncbi:zona pellucida protein C [Clarias gariepinus]